MTTDRPAQLHHGPIPSARWHAVTYGVQRLADAPDPFVADLQAWHTLLKPTACFTHLTSARLRGWWLPPLPDWLPVFVCMNSSQNPPRRPGLDVTRRVVAPPSEILDGIRVARADETILACADDLSVIDLVVIIDGALRRGDVAVDELAVLAGQHQRGAPRLREALIYADGRSESAWESLLRLLHVVGEIPVEPQQEIFDADGCFVARADLRVLGSNAVHEYDGGHHLSKEQQRRDLRRGRRIAGIDLVRRGYTSDDVPIAPCRSCATPTPRSVGSTTQAGSDRGTRCLTTPCSPARAGHACAGSLAWLRKLVAERLESGLANPICHQFSEGRAAIRRAACR